MLSSTEFTKTTAPNPSFCVKACTFADGCFSINAGKIKPDDDHVECHLIKGNMYANKATLIQKSNWIHISVKVNFVLVHTIELVLIRTVIFRP